MTGHASGEPAVRAAEPAMPDATRVGRGTVAQRLRARLVAGLSRLLTILPEGPVDRLGNLIGDAWYRVAGDRAALGRRNLQRVVRHLADEGLGGPRVAAAASDGAALERLLRATFRNTVRYYLDMARLPGRSGADLDRRLTIETPESVDQAFGPDAPAILVAMHFGAVEFPALFAVARSGRSLRAPMETIGDPPMQDWLRRTRSLAGVEIVGLRDARKSLLEALADGRPIGLVADRNVAGGTVTVPFFGSPAPLPMGPAFLAIEGGRPIYLAAVRRVGTGRYAGRLYPVEVAAGRKLRDRVEGTMANVARAMEAAIAVAPEQWWTLLSPVWPDLDARAATGTGRLEPEATS
jgi:phosphatidylinositol dimannoside acyltransferase